MTTTAQKSVAVTPGQLESLNRLVADAARKVIAEFGLDNPGAQRVIEHGDDFVAAISEAALAALKDLSVSDKFKDEEAESAYVYPEKYRIKSITEQTNILRQLFPGVGFTDEKLAEQPLPQHAEGYFAIPKWQTVGKTYEEALLKVLAAIAKQRKFYNYREGALGADRLRLTKRTAQFLEKLTGEQKGYDILVVPAQFGLRHRGRSVRRAIECMVSNEFGLDPFSVAIMILTHPERFEKYEDLCVDSSGCEYDYPDGTTRWSRALCFSFGGGKLFLGGHLNGADGSFGTASGFSPQ